MNGLQTLLLSLAGSKQYYVKQSKDKFGPVFQFVAKSNSLSQQRNQVRQFRGISLKFVQILKFLPQDAVIEKT